MGVEAQPSLILAGVAAGAVTDVLARRAAPSVAVAAGIAVLWLAYFGLYQLAEGGVAWTAELWVGTTVLAGLLAAGIGLLTHATGVGAVTEGEAHLSPSR